MRARPATITIPPQPYTWRQSVPQDLDWFPQMSETLLAVRYSQKRGVLIWPATTLCFGSNVIVVVGFAPNDSGGVDLWAEFSPFVSLAGYRVARAMKKRLTTLRQAVGARPVVLEVAFENEVAARFARFLGFRQTGTARFCKVQKLWMEKFVWEN